jgi:predicted amidohydrolase YtcJ
VRPFAAFVFGLLGLVGAAQADGAETILVNGKVIVYDGGPAEALAISHGRIVAVGRSTDVRAHQGSGTQVVDLDGRTVIPGLVDSHIHAIRAGLTFNTEVHWIGVRSLAEALDRVRQKARNTPAGSWLVVAGGWTERQFAEDRLLTQAELTAAAPRHLVYVQLLYGRVLLSPGGYEALGIANHQSLASRLSVERDAAGRPTGWLIGDNRAISDLFDLLPRPAFAQKVEGTRAFFRALNAVGLTGVIDPGGYNLPITEYQPLFALWREGGLTVRVRYSVCAPRRDHEPDDFAAILAMMPMRFGDDWLRFNGIGENVTWGMYNNDTPSEAQKEQLYNVLRWAVSRDMTATFHWHNERSVHHLLDVLERIASEHPLARLRWSIAHLNDASPQSLQRMRALGVGWLVQNALFFRGEAFLAQRGLELARLSPRIPDALRMGIPVGAGTDAHRVMWFNPFVSLQWMMHGTTVAGLAMRTPENSVSRLEALRLYTTGSAWFAFDEGDRGELAVGKLADLAVLDKDYLTVPVEEIGTIKSLLTMVGGIIVYADEPYASSGLGGAHSRP